MLVHKVLRTMRFFHVVCILTIITLPGLIHNVWKQFSPKPRPIIYKYRIVIIGAGPTSMGAAQRLHEYSKEFSNLSVTILEQQGKPGGLATSERDKQGFLWDMGGHVVFSHYDYFDKSLDRVVPAWNRRTRSAFAFMKGSDDRRRFIPYPVQNSIEVMDKVDQEKSLSGLEDIVRHPSKTKPANFDQWLLQNFGSGLCDVFMRKYNKKVWTVDATDMSSVWVGERVAVPDIEKIKSKITAFDNGSPAEDSAWGPNRFFRFPKYNGTGGIWEAVALQIPVNWLKLHQRVINVNINSKTITVQNTDGHVNYTSIVQYDTLISTVPLDRLVHMISGDDPSLNQMKILSSQLVFSHTHIVGVGLAGQPPLMLSNKSWMYFPDFDSPFYRVTVFSSYSDNHVPRKGAYWSLMCETAEPQSTSSNDSWSKENLIAETINALIRYGFITAESVASVYHRRLEYGYPVPSLSRDAILNIVQPWLESKDIFSRGRFGGWRYEVSNQDHSFMQGVEIVDRLIQAIPEQTYFQPNLVNSRRNTARQFLTNSPLKYEFVIAHYKESLDWLSPVANHCHVYHKGDALQPPLLPLYAWEKLPNVGREGHTYLHHIITKYNQLADITIFLQGDATELNKKFCFKPMDFVKYAKKNIFCRKRLTRYRNWGRVLSSNKTMEKLRRGELRRSNVTFGEFYEKIFGFPHPRGIPVCFRGCFSATRNKIRRHPPEFYKKIISFLDDHSDPEEGHYLERLWYTIVS